MSLVLDNPLTVYYNGVDLNSINGVTITERDPNKMPSKELRIHKLARTDGSILTTSEYGEKSLLVTGVIIRSSREEAETSLDALRALLAEQEGEIDIMVAGATRRYIGTLADMSHTLKGGFCKFTMEFRCAYPFGTELGTVTLINAEEHVEGNDAFSLAIEGSYKAEPLITITYDSITNGTDATVSLYNNADGIGLDITRDWVTGDLLEVDNFNKTLRVNSVDVTRTGRFFSFLPGSRSLGYNDTFSAREMTLTVSYRKRFV